MNCFAYVFIPGLLCLGKNHIGNPGIYNFDETKLTINVTGLGLTGFQVYDLMFSDYQIQLELADVYNILAIVNLGDDHESIQRLVIAFKDLSKRFYGKKEQIATYPIPLHNPELKKNPRDAYYSVKEICSNYGLRRTHNGGIYHGLPTWNSDSCSW